MIITDDKFVDMMGRMNEEMTKNSGCMQLAYKHTVKEDVGLLAKAILSAGASTSKIHWMI
jgi:hypothetical protein